MSSEEEVLQDGTHRRVVRVGRTVRRPMQPWSPEVHALLRHLEAVGFPYAPRVLGVDEQGREILTFIEGESGAQSWSKVVPEAGLAAFARLLREYHDAVDGFADETICHGDFGPWNVVWQGSKPVGIIDWDHARPAPRQHDVAYALEYVAPFRDDTVCVRWLGYSKAPRRAQRIEAFAAAYGLTSTDGLIDAVIAVQQETLERVRRLAESGHQPQATWAADGYLEELAARRAWTEDHRHLFEHDQPELNRPL
ncbi:phosphotransferase [Nonomuraea sp. NN258]|uniref:phosphotransferase n=1 Tax=Nonomuraea antri TaxID=2730852 RepID=UPI0015681C14|nr:phosphotransferase [Nonomuraea antri]NRQ36514.1 phosphotransferase [Nonomuraea antri]